MIYSKQDQHVDILTPAMSFTPVSVDSYSAGYSAIKPTSSWFENDVHATGSFVISTYIDGVTTCKFIGMHKTAKVVYATNLSNIHMLEFTGFPKFKLLGSSSTSSKLLNLLIHIRIDNGSTADTLICPATIDSSGYFSIDLDKRVPLTSDYYFSYGDILDITLPYVEYPCEAYSL